jgi:hypothetical protein
MSLDKKLPTDAEKLKEAAAKTDNPQMKRAIENRLKTMENNQTVRK